MSKSQYPFSNVRQSQFEIFPTVKVGLLLVYISTFQSINTVGRKFNWYIRDPISYTKVNCSPVASLVNWTGDVGVSIKLQYCWTNKATWNLTAAVVFVVVCGYVIIKKLRLLRLILCYGHSIKIQKSWII